jgi:hypothetical protein
VNTVVPPAWIIQEKKRREDERQKIQDESNSIPISLPKDFDSDDEYPETRTPIQDDSRKTTIIVIDL